MNTFANPDLPRDTLVEIIRAQADIAKAGMNLPEVMSLVCSSAQRLTQATGAIIELVEDDEMVYRAVSGITELQLGLRLPKAGSLSGLCVEERQILICNDTQTDPRVDRNACRRVGIRSMIVVPLDFLGITIGVLKVASSQTDAFGEPQVAILGLIAEMIGATMFYATQNTDTGLRELYYRATHDPLTGLANRNLFFDRLRKDVALAERHNNHLAIAVIDMDNLKQINDEHGHRAGDACIQEVGKRILAISRRSDTVARLGGDEFAVILSPVDDQLNAKELIIRLQQQIEKPFQFEHLDLPLRASAGIAIYPEDTDDLNQLFDKADLAMYYHKQQRKRGLESTPPPKP